MQSQSTTITTTLSFLSPIPTNLQFQSNVISSILSAPASFSFYKSTRPTIEMMDYTIITDNRRTNNTPRSNAGDMDWKLESAATSNDEDAMEINEDEDEIDVDEDAMEIDEDAMEIDEDEDDEIDPDL